jgi:hypothetical protein
MKVIAINDQHRPAEIPSTHWIKKDEPYTVTRVMKCHAQGGILGFELEEIDLKPFSPWEYFAAYRFAIVQERPEEELIEELELTAL